MKSTIERYTCDMCGADIDPGDPFRVLCSNGAYNTIPIHCYNPAYDEGYRTCISWELIDLCPECAVRACAIHGEYVRSEDGSWHLDLSWRDGR